MRINFLSLLIAGSLLLSVTSCKDNNLKDKPSKVKVEFKNNQYKLLVNDKPFYIKGAGVEFGNIEALAKHKGNAFRTWRTRNGKEDAITILDKAHKNGLMVFMGLEIGSERHGFDYNDKEKVDSQYNYIKQEIIRLKDHPALLGWIIGNELNLFADSLIVYKEVNRLSEMIHSEDPNHPTTTALAGISKREIDYIKKFCTDIDFISIQMYGDIVNLHQRVSDSGWDGPYAVTEWGVKGHWEVPVTSWGAYIEPDSHEKAQMLKNHYEAAIKPDDNRCLGSFVFLWGSKQEKTPTWYGLFLESGEETESVDMVHFLWNGNWPENMSPLISEFSINNKNAFDNIKIKKSGFIDAKVIAFDPDNDSITYKWEILPESRDQSVGGDIEDRPVSVYSAFGNDSVSIKSPADTGAYRLFIYIFDNKSHAATANIPFYVE